MSASSLRYDVSLVMRLVRAIPVVSVYFACGFLLFIFLPESARAIPLESIAVLGFIGLWRYTWLITHCVRSALYEYVVYPKLQHEAQQLPDDEKYPKRLFFIVPTWKEKPDVTRTMMQSVLAEAAQIPSQVCLLYTSPSPRDATLSRMPSSA